MMKIKVKRIVATVVFVAVFIGLYTSIEEMLRYKPGSERIRVFYEEIEKDTLDVVFVGSSHAYYGVQAMDFWGDYGVPSYVAASATQAVGGSYYLIKDIIKRQQPKVICLDVYSFCGKKKVGSRENFKKLMGGMPHSINRIQMGEDLLEGTEFGERLTYHSSMLSYHGRWTELMPEDIKRNEDMQILKGGKVSYTRKPQSVPSAVTSGEVKEISEINLYYLDKIQEVCEENNVELMLLSTPFLGAKKGEEEYIRRQRIINAVGIYAQEKGIPFINYTFLTEELGIDPATDYRDFSHLNIYGARKMDAHLFEYLQSSYQLEDRRNEKEYQSWNEDLEKYKMILTTMEQEKRKGNANEDEE